MTTNMQSLYEHALPSRAVRYIASVRSTMTEPWLTDAPDRAVVIAGEQTAGRGRGARAWLTPPESALALSMVLRGDDDAGLVTMLAGLAVCEALDGYPLPRAQLKWPNDVLVAGKKVCGMLAEGHAEAVILGIGLNIAVDFAGTCLAERATSLNDHLREPLAPRDYPALVATILARVDAWRAAQRAHAASQYGGVAPSPVVAAWRARLVTLGADVQVHDGAQVWRGRAVDVTRDGGLVVALADGVRRTFYAGDVSLSGDGV